MSIDVSIIGGGVAGLSAALLTSKNGLVTHVFDTGDAGVSKAILDNYLGIMKMEGPDFIDLSRDQVQSHGAILHQEEEVLEVVPDGGEYRVVTSGGKYISKYIAKKYIRNISVYLENTIYPNLQVLVSIRSRFVYFT